MVIRYFLLLSLLMAPVMVLPMDSGLGLGLAENVPLFDRDAEAKKATQEAEAAINQVKAENEPKTHYSLDCFPDDLFSMIAEYVPVEDKFPNQLLPLPGTKFDVLFPDSKSSIRTEFNSKTKRVSEYVINRQEIRIFDVTHTVPFLICALEHQNKIRFAQFSQDGTHIVTISRNNQFDTVHVWNIETGKQLYSYSNETQIDDANFNPNNNNQIIIACSDKIVRVSDITKQCVVYELDHNGLNEGRVSSAVFQPHGSLIATSLGKNIFLWDINTKKVVHEFKSDLRNHIIKIVFSGDGTRLIAMGEDYNAQIQVWNIQTLTSDFVSNFLRERIYSVAINADGSQALIGSAYGTAYVWDIGTEKIIYKLHHPDTLNKHFDHNYIVSVFFDEDNDRVITGSSGGSLRAWDLSPLKKLAQGKITQEQYKFLNLLAQYDNYCTTTLMPRFEERRITPSFLIRFGLALIRNRNSSPNDNLFYIFYPLDLSILADKYSIPAKELRAALDSFDPEIRAYIIKKYNIKTDWFYWCTRPAVLYSAAGVALAGLGTYFGYKLFKR